MYFYYRALCANRDSLALGGERVGEIFAEPHPSVCPKAWERRLPGSPHTHTNKLWRSKALDIFQRPTVLVIYDSAPFLQNGILVVLLWRPFIDRGGCEVSLGSVTTLHRPTRAWSIHNVLSRASNVIIMGPVNTAKPLYYWDCGSRICRGPFWMFICVHSMAALNSYAFEN